MHTSAGGGRGGSCRCWSGGCDVLRLTFPVQEQRCHRLPDVAVGVSGYPFSHGGDYAAGAQQIHPIVQLLQHLKHTAVLHQKSDSSCWNRNIISVFQAPKDQTCFLAAAQSSRDWPSCHASTGSPAELEATNYHNLLKRFAVLILKNGYRSMMAPQNMDECVAKTFPVLQGECTAPLSMPKVKTFREGMTICSFLCLP